MLIQIHMLQNYAPANLNRDQSGAPKDATFGGYQRGRISSQCLKRSMRRSDIFREAFEEDGLLADRTLLLPREVDKELQELGADPKARQIIVERLQEFGKKEGRSKKKEEDEDETPKMKILIYLTPTETKEVSNLLWELYQEKGHKGFSGMKIKDIEKAIMHTTPRSVDIAMFGRMTTSIAFQNVEASVQVAHALSANTLKREYDFFTAVDDLTGEAGAGFLGDTEFNSSTYYKYFNIQWKELVDNLGEDQEMARKAVSVLLEAATFAQPSGKQNSFAAHNLPDFILIEVTPKNIPVSYANAFIRPANALEHQSLTQNAIMKLDKYAGKLRAAYTLDGKRAYMTVEDASFDDAEALPSLQALQSWLDKQIEEASNE